MICDVYAVPIHSFCYEDPVQVRGGAETEASALAAVLAEGWTVVPKDHGGWTGTDSVGEVWQIAVRPRSLCDDFRCGICNPAAAACRRRLWAGSIEDACATAPFFRQEAMALCRRIDRDDASPVLALETLAEMAGGLAPDIDALHRACRMFLEHGETTYAGVLDSIIRRRQRRSGQHRLAAALLRLADDIAAHWLFAPRFEPSRSPRQALETEA